MFPLQHPLLGLQDTEPIQLSGLLWLFLHPTGLLFPSSGPLCCYWCFLIPNETRGRGSITPECPEGVWCVSSQFLPKLSPHLCCPVFGTQKAEIFLCHYCIPLAHGGHIPFLLTTLQVVGSCMGEKDPPGNMLQKCSFCIHGRSLVVSSRRRGILGQRLWMPYTLWRHSVLCFLGQGDGQNLPWTSLSLYNLFPLRSRSSSPHPQLAPHHWFW